jgi:hypothetical protein
MVMEIIKREDGHIVEQFIGGEIPYLSGIAQKMVEVLVDRKHRIGSLAGEWEIRISYLTEEELALKLRQPVPRTGEYL